MSAVIQSIEAVSPNMEHKHQTKQPIDLVHLAKYTMGDSALEEEILNLFARQSQVYMGQLQKAASAKEWYATAHTLKGSAKSVGACHVANLAEIGENIAETANEDEKLAFLAKLRVELDLVTNYIDGLLGKKSA